MDMWESNLRSKKRLENFFWIGNSKEERERIEKIKNKYKIVFIEAEV